MLFQDELEKWSRWPIALFHYFIIAQLELQRRPRQRPQTPVLTQARTPLTIMVVMM
jgi:hypothetical protein